MSPEADPSIWKEAAQWLWGLLLLPVAALWRKVEASATREELREAIAEFKESNKTLRESVVKLFGNAEEDRRRYEQRFVDMQKSIHDIHLSIVSKIAERSDGNVQKILQEIRVMQDRR